MDASDSLLCSLVSFNVPVSVPYSQSQFQDKMFLKYYLGILCYKFKYFKRNINYIKRLVVDLLCYYLNNL